MVGYLSMREGDKELKFLSYGFLGELDRVMSEKLGTTGVGLGLLLGLDGPWEGERILQLEAEAYPDPDDFESSETVYTFYRVDPQSGELEKINLWEPVK